MNAHSTKTELELVLDYLGRLSNGLALIDRPDLAHYVANLRGLLRTAAQFRPEILETREQLAEYFEANAGFLETKAATPGEPPGAVDGCKPFVKVSRMVARAIRGGVHALGEEQRTAFAEVQDLVRGVS